MTIDLDLPQFTHKEAADCTSADFKTIDNYDMHKHVVAFRVDGRRLYSARQLIEIELISRLAVLFKIPPSVGRIITQRVLEDVPPYALDHGFSREWDGQVSIRRLDDGAVHLMGPDERAEDAIDLIIPVQTFGRAVLQKAAALREAS